MIDADAISQRRAEMRQEQAQKELHKESIDAVTGSGKDVVASTDKLAKSSDIDGLIKQMKELQLTQLLSNQAGSNKPPVVLTDQTDLGEKISELTSKLVATVKELDSKDMDGKQINELVRVVSSLDALNSLITNNFKYAQKERKDMIAAIKALKLSQVVNVPTPKVTVESSKIDLSPITDAIERTYRAPEETGIDLECFRPQDIDNTNPDIQYIGFVNPDGKWYIIENDVKGNRMRYLFGNSDYEQSFSRASMYTYSLLNEAIDAIQT